MKLNLTKILALMLAATVLLIPVDSDAQSRKRSGAKRRAAAAASLPAIKKTDKTLQIGATIVSVTHYDAPAYYKVSKDEAGFSNGYSDNSFSIDWPTAVSTGDVASVQQWILDNLSSEEQRVKSLDELIKKSNACEFSGRRVAKLPKDDSECLRNKSAVTASLATAGILMLQVEYDAYFGGGTGSSIMYGTTYHYYDLAKQRGLKACDLFTAGVANLIGNNLERCVDSYEDISDEFKSEPFVPENFLLAKDKVTFIYSKYEIGPGYMGNIEVEVPMQQIMQCATPALKSIINAMN